MENIEQIKKVEETIQTAMLISKCKRCGCMKESLETINNELKKDDSKGILGLISVVQNSINEIEPIEYT